MVLLHLLEDKSSKARQGPGIIEALTALAMPRLDFRLACNRSRPLPLPRLILGILRACTEEIRSSNVIPTAGFSNQIYAQTQPLVYRSCAAQRVFEH